MKKLLSVHYIAYAVLDFGAHDCNGSPWLVFNRFEEILADDHFSKRIKVEVKLLIFSMYQLVK